jgi:hypothetical protein
MTRTQGGPTMTARHLGLTCALLALLSSAPNSTTLAQTAACGGAAAEQFDFWLGEWQVFDFTSGSLVGSNRIVRIHNCTLEENWQGTAGDTGTSFNNYRASEGKWHQVWVNSNGAFLHLVGAFKNGAMVLIGEGIRPIRGINVLNRVTWSRVENDPNRVRQFWEISRDGGQSWSVDFDGLYRRRQP